MATARLLGVTARPRDANREVRLAAADCSLAASAAGEAEATVMTTVVSPTACRRRRLAVADTLTQAAGQLSSLATAVLMAAEWEITAALLVPVRDRVSLTPVVGAGPVVVGEGEGEGVTTTGEGEMAGDGEAGEGEVEGEAGDGDGIVVVGGMTLTGPACTGVEPLKEMRMPLTQSAGSVRVWVWLGG